MPISIKYHKVSDYRISDKPVPLAFHVELPPQQPSTTKYIFERVKVEPGITDKSQSFMYAKQGLNLHLFFILGPGPSQKCVNNDSFVGTKHVRGCVPPFFRSSTDDEECDEDDHQMNEAGTVMTLQL